jgi:hypothetical protein
MDALCGIAAAAAARKRERSEAMLHQQLLFFLCSQLNAVRLQNTAGN